MIIAVISEHIHSIYQQGLKMSHQDNFAAKTELEVE